MFLQQLIYKKRFLADKASSKYNHSPQCQSERIQRFTKKGKKSLRGESIAVITGRSTQNIYTDICQNIKFTVLLL